MAFYEVQFPQNIAYGAKGGSGFLTRIVSTQAGYEFRAGEWGQIRGSWDVGYGIKQPSDLQALIQFFVTMNGRAHGFRFRDWNDYTDWGIGTFQTDPETGALTLAKTYVSPNPVTGVTVAQYTRFIKKPVPGTLTLPGGASVDYTTGIVTGGLVNQVWTGQFDVPVRFDVDKIDAVIEQPSGISGGAVASSWPHIPIVELRL